MKISTQNSLLRVILIVIISIFISQNLFALHGRDTLAPYWSKFNAPVGNDITFLKCDSNNVLYMGIWGLGIAKSNNEGQTWVWITTGMTNLFVNCLEIDSAGVFYAGTNGNGVFRSTNSGLNWSEFNTGMNHKFVKTLTSRRGGPIFAGTMGGGVYRFKPGSSKWEQANTGMWFMDISALIITREGSLMAGTNGDGIYRTDDDGNSWRRSTGGLPEKTITSIVMDDLGQYYCGTLGGGLYFSPTMGVNWSVYKASPIVLHVSGVAINGKRDPVVTLADFGIYRYDTYIYDTWRKSNMTYSGANCIVRMKSGNLYAGVPNYGLYKSIDEGASWNRLTESFKADTGITPLLALDGGFVMASDIDAKDVWISKNYGFSWTKTNLPANSVVTALGADSSNNILVALRISGSSALMSSNDKGTTWTQIKAFTDTTIGAIGCKSGGIIFLGLAFPPGNPKATPPDPTSVLCRTTDNGANWTFLQYRANSDGFKFIKFSRRDGSVYSRFNNGLNRSSNNGTSWTKILDSTVMTEDVDFNMSGDIFVGTDQGLRKSTNNGGTWTMNKFGVNYAQIKKVLVTRTNELYLGFSGNLGILRSFNGGNTFDSISNAVNRATVQGLTASPDGYIYLSTSNLYRTVEPADMVAPTTLLPTDWQGGVALLPTLVWSSAPKALLYEMQIARDLDFNTIQEHFTTGDTSRTLTRSLDYNNVYFWRVRSRFNNSLSDWSPYSILNTVIKYPELMSPLSNAKGSPQALTCTWHKVDGAGAYIFQLSKEANFGTTLVNKEVTDTTMKVSGLELYTKYHWRVQAKANKTFSDWSEVWNFTTRLNMPTLKAPAHRTIGMDTLALLEWNPAQGATGYEVQIAKDSIFKAMIFEGETQNLLSHKTKLLEYFTTYWWRIRSKDDFSISDWSIPWSFTTTLQAPLLALPENKTNDLSADSVKFEWIEFPDAENFVLIIAKDAGFNQVIYTDSSFKGTKAIVYKFDHYTTYYWKLRVKVGRHLGLWSETRSFSTGIDSPVLTSPADKTMNAKTEVIFIWETVNGAKYYQIQIATDDKFTSKIADTDSLVFPRFTQPGLSYETKYFWRTLGQYENGVSKWSSPWSFTTETKNDVIEDLGIGFKASIYPNPANSFVKFNVELKNASPLTINVYTMNGELVRELVNQTISEGNYLFDMDASSLSSGSYMYKIIAGGKEFNGMINIIK